MEVKKWLSNRDRCRSKIAYMKQQKKHDKYLQNERTPEWYSQKIVEEKAYYTWLRKRRSPKNICSLE